MVYTETIQGTLAIQEEPKAARVKEHRPEGGQAGEKRSQEPREKGSNMLNQGNHMPAPGLVLLPDVISFRS